MRKYLLQILLLVTSVCCTRNTGQYICQGNKGADIQFNISMPDLNSRSATPINTNDIMDGMSVGFYAYMTNYDAPHTKELRAENVQLTYDKATNTWVYPEGVEPIKWDFNYTYDRFTFYVYSPYDENSTNVNFDMENESFSVDYDMVTDQDVDLMIAQLENISYPMGGVVTIDLKHALSLIAFNTDYTNPIEEVRFCSASTYRTMPKRGSASLSNGKVQWTINDFYTSEYSYSLGDTAGSYALIIPQTVPNKGDLYFSMSYNDGKTPIDNGAQAPKGMEFEAGRKYTFKYKGAYFDYDEDENTLVIDIDEFYKSHDRNDYSVIDKIIEKIKKEGATLKCEGTICEDPHNLLIHIITQAQGVENIDFSEIILPKDIKIPYALFDNDVTQKSMKNIKLPVMDDSNFYVALLDDCTALEEIEFAEGSTMTQLQYNFCKGCTSLKKMNLEVLTHLQEVSQASFYGCTSLEEITLPKSVTTIGHQAISNCTSLRKINIPASLKTIVNEAFRNCTSLYSYDHDGEKAGFSLDPRDIGSLVNVNYMAFVSTNVLSIIDNKVWWTSSNSESQIFTKP